MWYPIALPKRKGEKIIIYVLIQCAKFLQNIQCNSINLKKKKKRRIIQLLTVQMLPNRLNVFAS